MDIEKPLRKKLISLLDSEFDCFEEVDLYSNHFDREVRCDVLARKKCELTNEPLIFAFEVKKTETWSVKKYCDAIHQAYGYVSAKVKNQPGTLTGSIVDAAFVFPGPEWRWKGSLNADDESLLISGVGLLGGRLNVGQARVDIKNRINLFMGAAEIWIGGKGWGVKHLRNFPVEVFLHVK